MPSGKLTTIVLESTTEEYPRGCAATAWNNLKKEIGKNLLMIEENLRNNFIQTHHWKKEKSSKIY